MSAPPILAISGPSGVGKTTLLVKLIPALRARGLTVAALKHSGHPHSFDRPQKDSARLRRAGAIAVAVQGPVELAYFGPPVRGLRALARLLPPSDLILAEGFKTEAMPRLEVHRRAVGDAFQCARDPRVVAVVSDEPPPRPVPWFTARDIDGLAGFVEAFALTGGRARRRALASGGPRGQRWDGEAGRSRRHAEAGPPRETSMASTRSSSRGTSRSRAGQERTGSSRVGSSTVREAGRKGGRRTLERRGPEFYSRIGRKGGKSSGGARRAAARAGQGGARSGGARSGGARSGGAPGGGARGGKRTR